MKKSFLILCCAFIISCKTRVNEQKASDVNDATVVVTQASRLAELDGFNEMLVFNDHFWFKDALTPSHRCIYASIARVRTEEALYDAKKREARFDWHVKNASLIFDSSELKNVVVQKLGLKSPKDLTLKQDEFLKAVHPVSDDFLLKFLEDETRSSIDKMTNTQCNREQIAESTIELDNAYGDATKIMGIAGGLVGGILAACLPVSAPAAMVLPLFPGGIVLLPALYFTTGLASHNTLKGSKLVANHYSAKSAKRVLKSLQDLQASFAENQQVLESLYGSSSSEAEFELYPKKHMIDELAKLQADQNLTLKDFEKDPNKENRELLSVRIQNAFWQKAVLEAHVQAADQIKNGQWTNTVLQNETCASDAKQLVVKNDLKFWDEIKSGDLW